MRANTRRARWCTVRVTGSPPEGLQVEVRNPRPVQTARSRPAASGLGLLGLQERVSLAGGHLRHGPDPTAGMRSPPGCPGRPSRPPA
jgi:signal transduction histidine kinase